MIHVNFSIRFLVKALKSDPNKSFLYLRLSLRKEKKEIALKIKVNPELWNQQQQCMDGKSESSKVINNEIEMIKTRLRKIYNDLRFQNGEAKMDEVLNVYLGNNRLHGKHSLLEIFDIHNKRAAALEGKGYAHNTIVRFNTTRDHVANFLKVTYKQNDIDLSKLNFQFIEEVHNYFVVSKKCCHNTSVKYIRIIKKIIKLAIQYEWLDKDPFINFKQSLDEVPRGHLSERELDLLEELILVKYKDQRVRDLFIFCCYTGLSYCDAASLRQDQIVVYPDGELWINIHRKKTGGKTHIPLLDKALAILEKYKNDPECDVKGTVLPFVSNANMNTTLKILAKMAGIKKNISMHLARHTFATTITLNNDVPLETVSQLLGHRSLRTSSIYAKVLDKKTDKDMKLLKEKLNKKKIN